MPYTKLVDLQERLSKLCVVKEVKLLEKELSVMRILHVLQFLLPHWAIVQSVGANIWSVSTSTIFTLHGLIWMNLSAFLYQRLLSSLTTFPNLVMSRSTIRGTPTSAAVPVSGGTAVQNELWIKMPHTTYAFRLGQLEWFYCFLISIPNGWERMFRKYAKFHKYHLFKGTDYFWYLVSSLVFRVSWTYIVVLYC